MKTPQIEDGYTRIANGLLDAFISYRMSGEEVQVLLFVIRKTYGYRKKFDYIKIFQIVKATGMKKQNASRSLKQLIKKNIVIKTDDGLSVNKDKSTWKQSSKLITPVIKTDDKASSKLITTKEIYKENILTNVSTGIPEAKVLEIPKKNPVSGHPYASMITYCREKQGITHEFVNYVKQTTACKRIIASGYSESDVRFVIDEMAAEDFWKANPFDMMSVANSMHKYMNRTVMFKKGDLKNNTYAYARRISSTN